MKEPNRALQVGSGVVGAAHSYRPGDIQGVVSAMDGMMRTSSAAKRAQQLTSTQRTSSADVISWSGCKDSEKSWDIVQSGEATGAMSHAFIQTLTKNPNQSYQQLLRNIRNILKQGKYRQKPQLSSSHPMDTSVLFIA